MSVVPVPTPASPAPARLEPGDLLAVLGGPAPAGPTPEPAHPPAALPAALAGLMRAAPGGAGSTAASVLVAALERAWTAIRARHPQVPEVVMAVASGSVGRRGELRLGHFADRRWRVATAERPELFVGGEGLAAGAVEVLGTLLHEAAHGLATTRGVQDTSRQGRYHNRRYAALAGELGLTVQRAGSRGWTATAVPAETEATYAAVIDDLARALVLWRRAEHQGPGKRASNLLAAVCGCGRRIRAARSTLAEAPVLCGRCGGPFQPPEDQGTDFDT